MVSTILLINLLTPPLKYNEGMLITVRVCWLELGCGLNLFLEHNEIRNDFAEMFVMMPATKNAQLVFLCRTKGPPEL